MDKVSPGIILIRYSSEVVIKGRPAKARFATRVRRHIRKLARLNQLECELIKGFNCLVLKSPQAEEFIPLLKRVFGIGLFCPVVGTCGADLDEILKVGLEIFRERIQGKTYAVRAKKVGTSSVPRRQVEIQLGSVLNPFGTVNLTEPEVTVHVDVNNDEVLFYCQRIRGAGGLPCGSQGSALALMSGGFDSAVAAWRIMRRGVAVHFLFCNLGGAAYERSVLQVTKVLCELWGRAYYPRFYSVDFGQIAQELRREVGGAGQQVALKRKMYEVASRLGEELEVDALITGEAIGQVSSQVLRNLKLIEEKATLPVLRPLVGMDKEEIMAEAKHVGTAVLSEKIREFCGLGGEKPMISGRRDKVEPGEARLSQELVDDCLENLKKRDIHAVDGVTLRKDFLFVEAVPSEAEVIDCQEAHMRRDWQWPRSTHIDWETLVSGTQKLDKTKVYVVYCTYGTKAPLAAEVLQLQGYEVYALRGTINQVRELATQTLTH
ncbi:MAG: tRNA 4-thiouridine(8) synthase ThiI [Bdellovibrionaceae bacterium]|nr:hypothetical protein [Bdellovibrionales bacterium]MCB9082700.1 tRNA 4-thiouridine(8) synthase ThiI [Pseudobdellovibrionaceae bacterium]